MRLDNSDNQPDAAASWGCKAAESLVTNHTPREPHNETLMKLVQPDQIAGSVCNNQPAVGTKASLCARVKLNSVFVGRVGPATERDFNLAFADGTFKCVAILALLGRCNPDQTHHGVAIWADWAFG